MFSRFVLVVIQDIHVLVLYYSPLAAGPTTVHAFVIHCVSNLRLIETHAALMHTK